MIIISIIEFFVCGTIYYFADNPVIFVIENLLVACCLSGTFTMITPLFKDIFEDLGTEMYGLTGFFIGLASFTGPILTKSLIKEDSDYLKIYLLGGGICLIKFIALLFFDEKTKFKFKAQIKEEKNINSEEAQGILNFRPTESSNV